jgi:creatinine amidohydrolase
LGLVHYFNPGRKDWLSQLAGAHRNLGHACTFETSIQMALRPGERERMQSRVQGLKPRLEPPFSAAGDLANLRESGLIWAWLFGPGDIGYYGDPAAALKGDPELILQLTVDALARFFDEYAAAKLRVGPSS